MIARKELDIYSKDKQEELSNKKGRESWSFIESLKQSNLNLSQQLNHSLTQKKKRNIFMSNEDPGVEDEDEQREQHMKQQLVFSQRLGGFQSKMASLSQMQPGQEQYGQGQGREKKPQSKV